MKKQYIITIKQSKSIVTMQTISTILQLLTKMLKTSNKQKITIKWELVQKLIENQNTKITSKRERYDDQGLSDDEVESKKSNFKNKYKKNFK